MNEHQLAVAMKDDKRLSSLLNTDFNLLHILLFNPMLSNKEIAAMFDYPPSYVDNHCNTLYQKLIPTEIYDSLTPSKRRLYVILKYSPLFAEMPESWHEALIDPMFKAKEKP